MENFIHWSRCNYPQHHTKYQNKSRSDNTPHIYSVADSAYQDVLHHEEPQHILFAGESNSGKTTNMMHLIEHLMYLGKVCTRRARGHDDKIPILSSFDTVYSLINLYTFRFFLLFSYIIGCLVYMLSFFKNIYSIKDFLFVFAELERYRSESYKGDQPDSRIYKRSDSVEYKFD